MPAGTDAEATLSAEYGGTGGSNAAVDAVYVALGRVLTISGRTIKDEAQVSPTNILCVSDKGVAHHWQPEETPIICRHAFLACAGAQQVHGVYLTDPAATTQFEY